MPIRILSTTTSTAACRPAPAPRRWSRRSSPLARGELSLAAALGRSAPRAPAGFLGLMPAYRGGERPAVRAEGGLHLPRQPAQARDRRAPGRRARCTTARRASSTAVVDGSAITAIRTAAVSARRHAGARPRRTPATSRSLGAGVAGARRTSHALAEALPLRARCASRAARSSMRRRSPTSSARYPFPLEAVALGGRRAARRRRRRAPSTDRPRADRRARAGSSPGMHVNARRLEHPAHARARRGAASPRTRLFVDRRESTVNEAGDFLFALREGAIGERPHRRRARRGARPAAPRAARSTTRSRCSSRSASRSRTWPPPSSPSRDGRASRRRRRRSPW